MNWNISILCETCESQTNCRLGMSNRRVQPLRFRCKSCGAPIDITMVPDFEEISIDIRVVGATQIETQTFEAGTSFVDLHLDFPVSFDDYVMGRTPFMMASMRIGHEKMQEFIMRINYLNEVYDNAKEIKELFTLYAGDKHDIFEEKVLTFLGSSMPCKTQLDRNRSLYFAIEKAFLPFSEPQRNVDAVKLFTSELIELENSNKDSLVEFINEIVSSGFLKNVQTDCLEIYPRIIDIELMLRPALFLDFDRSYGGHNVPYRVSAHEFLDAKDLYKDIAEIISRSLVLVAGINNLKKRGSHNVFLEMSDTPKNLSKFADYPLGRKIEFIDNSWYPIKGSILDNHLRNSVAHYKAEYDEVTQQITYYPKREGMKQEQSETMFFLDFSRRVLSSFRELHRLNHLTKCLFVFYYIGITGEKGTSDGF